MNAVESRRCSSFPSISFIKSYLHKAFMWFAHEEQQEKRRKKKCNERKFSHQINQNMKRPSSVCWEKNLKAKREYLNWKKWKKRKKKITFQMEYKHWGSVLAGLSYNGTSMLFNSSLSHSLIHSRRRCIWWWFCCCCCYYSCVGIPAIFYSPWLRWNERTFFFACAFFWIHES